MIATKLNSPSDFLFVALLACSRQARSILRLVSVCFNQPHLAGHMHGLSIRARGYIHMIHAYILSSPPERVYFSNGLYGV
jgi:hypothetical protein